MGGQGGWGGGGRGEGLDPQMYDDNAGQNTGQNRQKLARERIK